MYFKTSENIIYKLVKNEAKKQKKAVITSLLFCTKNGAKNIFKKLEKSIDTCRKKQQNNKRSTTKQKERKSTLKSK